MNSKTIVNTNNERSPQRRGAPDVCPKKPYQRPKLQACGTIQELAKTGEPNPQMNADVVPYIDILS